MMGEMNRPAGTEVSAGEKGRSMIRTGVIMAIAVFAVAAGAFFFRTVRADSKEHQVSSYMEQLAGKVTEMEEKINDLVAYQIKSSENNRQVYGAVARLCTIFEGILQINQKAGEPAAAGK